ncbi:MAG: hypothetical protein NZM04_07400 [Methylacidiphilales bacterium]|nr:hypothetical protein [Candidatus Methylacidiphilales bacterium]MDW8349210.1 Amuc_1099 family pilus-like system protein [Verrucomicrobiae bacterium]
MKNHWHHLLLILLSLIAAALLFQKATSFPTPEEIGGPNLKKPPQKNLTPPTKEELQAIQSPWTEPKEWIAPPGVPNQLFIPRMWLYFPDRNEAELIQGNLEIDGIPISWFEKYRINWRIPKIAFIDSDQDGFSNLYEYRKNTAPSDPQEHPDYTELLRLKDFEIIPFRLRFQAVNMLDGQEVFQINLMDDNPRFPRTLRAFNKRIKERMITPEAAKLLPERDRVFQHFIIDAYRPKRQTQFNESTNLTEEVDVSELDIVDERIGVPITLVLNKITISPDSSAVLIPLLPGRTNQEIRVRQGEDFEFQSQQYRLIKATSENAIIRNLANDTEITIPRLQNKDLDLVPINSTAPPLEPTETPSPTTSPDTTRTTSPLPADQ